MRSQHPKTKLSSASIQDQMKNDIQDIQKLADLGRLSASLIHEISNPLTSALIYLEQYKDHSSIGAKKALKSIRAISRYVDAARQQIRRESRIRDFSLFSQVNQLKQVVNPVAEHCGIRLSIGVIPRVKIHGDPVKFQQILSNLIINAIEAYDYDNYPKLKKHVEVSFTLKSKILCIKVIDWGKGITSDELRHIFNIQYSTKNVSGHSLGLGLAIVNEYLVNDFSGHMSVSSSARLGTIFKVNIPIRT